MAKTKEDLKKAFIALKKPESLLKIVVMVILYILLGNFRAIQANPMVPGAVVAVNMIVVVLAGILFGRYIGLIVGLLGTFLNALIMPGANSFEFAAILPHTLMGGFAGYLRERHSIFTSSLAILVGHILNIVLFILYGLLAISVLSTGKFYLGLGFIQVYLLRKHRNCYISSFKEN